MKIGIVGNGADKFTAFGAMQARELIAALLQRGDTVVSGHSPMGGVDIWAEELAEKLGKKRDIKAPSRQSWGELGGYRDRNMAIAHSSDEVNVIVVDKYPMGYGGRKFSHCYHCFDAHGPHVKSGGCWTGNQAAKLGKPVMWHVIKNFMEVLDER